MTTPEPSAPAVPLRAGLSLLVSYARPHLRILLVGVLLGLFATAVTLATPMAAKWVLDAGKVRESGTHRELVVRDEPYREFIEDLRIHTGTPDSGA